MLIFVFLKETSTDSSVEPGLEGNWMGGREIHWEAANLIQ